MSYRSDCRVYVGNLPPDIRSRDVKEIFENYGRITSVDLKTNNKGPPFAFVEFEDGRDANEAVKRRHGMDYDGYRLRVEFPRERDSYRRGSYDDHRSSRNYSSNYRSNRNSYSNNFSRGRGRGARGGWSRNRVIVSDLPRTGSWQDLKDHMREAGDVFYTEVFKDGTGVCEFKTYDDMKWAVENLNDSRFESHEGETSKIRVRLDADADRSSRRYRSYSRSSSRSRSPHRRRKSPAVYR